MTEYPEHERMKKIADKSQAIGEFIDWLREKTITLMRWDDKLTDETTCWVGACEDGKIRLRDGTVKPCPSCKGKGYVTVKRPGYVPVAFMPLLYEFFEIDPNKIEAEKEQMLEELRVGR